MDIPNSMDIREIGGEVGPAVAFWFYKRLIFTVDGVVEERPVQAYDISEGWIRVWTYDGEIETLEGVVDVQPGIAKPVHNPCRTVRAPIPSARTPGPFDSPHYRSIIIGLTIGVLFGWWVF